jgi:hypothetical protein
MQQPYQPFASENITHSILVIFITSSGLLFLELFRRFSGLADRLARAEALLRKIDQSRSDTTVRSEELERRAMIVSQTVSSKIEKLEQLTNNNAARIEHLNQFSRQSKMELNDELRRQNAELRAELENLYDSTKHELESVSECFVEFRVFLKKYIEFEIRERKHLAENTGKTFLDLYKKIQMGNDNTIDDYYIQMNELQQLFSSK